MAERLFTKEVVAGSSPAARFIGNATGQQRYTPFQLAPPILYVIQWMLALVRNTEYEAVGHMLTGADQYCTRAGSNNW